MSAKVKRNARLLKTLSKADPATTKVIINTASPELIKAISECALNVLKGRVSLSHHQKNRLKRHKRALRQLIKRQTSAKKKKALLLKGGFLGALLRPVLGILGHLLFS